MPVLAEIAQACDVPLRKLRYVLDHGLLPGGHDASQGRGATRRFTDFEAFALVVAALMLQAGLRRALVRNAMAALVRGPSRDPDRIPLYQAFAHGDPARLELADWRFVRLTTAAYALWPALDTGWLALAEELPSGQSYTPVVSVVLDVGRIRRLIPPTNPFRVGSSRNPDTEVHVEQP